MLKKLLHPARRFHSEIREKSKSKRRSSRWDEVRDAFVFEHPSCAACGSTNKLQVHHILPFHLHPDLELDPKNLIVLCMDVNECHLEIGHGGSFKYYNPQVVIHAKRFLIEDEQSARQFIVEHSRMIREKA